MFRIEKWSNTQVLTLAAFRTLKTTIINYECSFNFSNQRYAYQVFQFIGLLVMFEFQFRNGGYCEIKRFKQYPV